MLPIRSTPPFTVTPPLKVLAAESSRVPLLLFTRRSPPYPLKSPITPDTVRSVADELVTSATSRVADVIDPLTMVSPDVMNDALVPETVMVAFEWKPSRGAVPDMYAPFCRVMLLL